MAKGNVAEILKQHLEDIKTPKPRIMTGYKDLDDALKGIRPSDFAIIAGGTGEFKSTLSTNVLLANLKQGHSAVMYNYEMSNLQSFRRILCGEMLTSLSDLEDPNQSKELIKATEEKAAELVKSNLYFVENNIDNVDMLLLDIARKKQEGFNLFIVDYIQLINSDKGSRVEQIEYVARKLRKAALSTDTVVLGISQLSRAHKREGGEPDLHDLKGSGGLENDATQVIFVFTKRYNEILRAKGITKAYLPSYRESELVIKKNRHGESGRRSRCIVLPSYYKFINIEDTVGVDPSKIGPFPCIGDEGRCNEEEFIIIGNEFYCAHCKSRYNTQCSRCNDTGYVRYTKMSHNYDYEYIGFCPSCPRGQALVSSIKATNSILDTPQDKITLLPFIKQVTPQEVSV